MEDFADLRLDEEYLHNDLKTDLLKDYTASFKSKVLTRRVNLLFTAYEL